MLMLAFSNLVVVVVVALACTQSSQPFNLGRQRLLRIVVAASCSKVAVEVVVVEAALHCGSHTL